MNYYRDLRQSVSSRRKTKMGAFDPLNAVVFLDESVSQFLDVRATQARQAGLEPVGSPALAPFATYLHESIHWWQHIGTTAGLFYGLSIPVQARCTALYLSETGTEFAKPLIHTVPESLAADHPANLVLERWTEIEFGAALLYSPPRANAQLQHAPQFYESLGHALLLLQISTVATIGKTFDPGRTGLPDAVEWLACYRDFVRSERRGFVPGELIEIPLGMEHLMEGQARLSELQYRSLTVEPMSYETAKQQGWLHGIYAQAFETYLERTALPAPDDFDDAIVNLFLLLCDIALNPSQGYPDTIDPTKDFVMEVHPGLRFLRLCAQVKRDAAVVGVVEKIGYSSYLRASQRLCEPLAWADPVAVGKRCLAIGERMSGFDDLQRRSEACALGKEDVPLHFYISRHLEFLRYRTECPHFYCWPGRFLGFTEAETASAVEFQELLSWSMPPFVTSSFASGVDAVNLDGWSAASRSKFVNDYFATQVLYDMVRQWISNRGVFRFEHQWKQNFSQADLDVFAAQFEKSIGITLEHITVL